MDGLAVWGPDTLRRAYRPDHMLEDVAGGCGCVVAEVRHHDRHGRRGTDSAAHAGLPYDVGDRVERRPVLRTGTTLVVLDGPATRSSIRRASAAAAGSSGSTWERWLRIP